MPNLADDYNAVFGAWNQSIMSVLSDLQSGRLQPHQLNENLFEATKNKLLDGVQKGGQYNYPKLDYSSQDYNFANHLRENIYSFAGAKTYTHLRALNDLLLDEKGNIRPKADIKADMNTYRAEAMQMEKQYNQQWLNTEIEFAIAQSQSAARELEYRQNNDLFPNRKYRTVGDGHVRHSHAIYDGWVYAWNDPIRLKISPVKDFGCRCWEEATDEDPTENKMPEGYTPNPVFPGLAADDGTIFSAKHPYFEASKKDKTAIQSAVDGFWLKERLTINKKIYDSYANDAEYIQERFNNDTGGFLIRHKNSQFSTLSAMPPQEQQVINLLIGRGDRIVIPQLTEYPYTKNFDLTINFSNWDVKQVTGNVKDRTTKNIQSAMDQAANVVLVYQSQPEIKEIVRALGNVKNEDRLNAVMFIFQNKMCVLSRAELLKNDFSALNILK